MTYIIYLYVKLMYFFFYWLLLSTIVLYVFLGVNVEPVYLKSIPPVLAGLAALLTNIPKNAQRQPRRVQQRPGTKN